MKSKDQQLLQEAYSLILEQTNLQDIIQRFKEEVLLNYSYKTVGKGHLNCAWATDIFCQWYEKTFKEPCRAIYFVWPTKETTSSLKEKGILPPYYEDNGMSHIAPVVGDSIVDFTFGQFDGDSSKTATITPLSDWKNRYSKYGYGTNQYEGKSVYVNEHKRLQAWSDAHGMGLKSMAPPKINSSK